MNPVGPALTPARTGPNAARRTEHVRDCKTARKALTEQLRPGCPLFGRCQCAAKFLDPLGNASPTLDENAAEEAYRAEFLKLIHIQPVFEVAALEVRKFRHQ